MSVQSFPTPGPVRLEVNLPLGGVEIVTSDDDESTVSTPPRGRLISSLTGPGVEKR